MITVIPGIPEHAPYMHQIETECFSEAWSEISIKYEIMHKHTICFVAIDDSGIREKVVGHVYMRHVVNEGHIMNLAVKKSHRRHGIGSMLVQSLIDAANERDMLGITLDVRASNRAAIALYETHEFAEEGRRKNYYKQPTEDGIIMWRYFDV